MNILKTAQLTLLTMSLIIFRLGLKTITATNSKPNFTGLTNGANLALSLESFDLNESIKIYPKLYSDA